MTVETITFEQAQGTLQRLAAERPDYVYERVEGVGCAYAVQGEEGELLPSCIVGHVLAEHAPEAFAKIAKCGLNGQRIRLIVQRAAPVGLDVDRDTLRLLTYAQNSQDAGYRWGTAVRDALSQAGVR